MRPVQLLPFAEFILDQIDQRLHRLFGVRPVGGYRNRSPQRHRQHQQPHDGLAGDGHLARFLDGDAAFELFGRLDKGRRRARVQPFEVLNPDFPDDPGHALSGFRNCDAMLM